jgi:hypothetical protein
MYCSGGEMDMNLYIHESVRGPSGRMVNLLVQICRKRVRRWQQPWRTRAIAAMEETGREWRVNWKRNGGCN